MGSVLGCGFYFVVTLFVGSAFAQADAQAMRELILGAAEWWKILMVVVVTSVVAVGVARVVAKGGTPAQ
jgi:hypothetical protein